MSPWFFKVTNVSAVTNVTNERSPLQAREEHTRQMSGQKMKRECDQELAKSSRAQRRSAEEGGPRPDGSVEATSTI